MGKNVACRMREDARSFSGPRFLRKKIVRCNAGGFPYRLPRRGRFRSEDDGERDASRETPGRERGSHPRNGGAARGLQRCGRAAGGAPPRRRSPWRRRSSSAHRMGRVHRPLRGDRDGRGARPRLRLSPGDQLRRRRDGRRRATCSSSSIRAPTRRRSIRRKADLDSARSPARVGDRPARSRAKRWSRATRYRRRPRRAAAGAAHGRGARAAGEGGAAGGAAQSRLHRGPRADLRPRLQPPRRHRQPRHRRSERDAADHHRRRSTRSTSSST